MHFFHYTTRCKDVLYWQYVFLNESNMKQLFYIIAILVGLDSCTSCESSQEVPYKNPNLPIEERVRDLLGRMTEREKIGQLLCPLGWEMYTIVGDSVVPSDAFVKLQEQADAGMLWATFRADPWTKKTLANGLNPQLAARAANALQGYVMTHSRLGIPLFFAEEAPHGHMAIGTTVFPTGLGMAATFDANLLRQVGGAIGEEVRSQGAHISYGPVLDLARDPRWSRVEETMGEDPCLTGTLGSAMVEGLGGGDLTKPFATIATLKHFLAYAVPEGGQNGAAASVGPRELRAMFLPPFKQAVDAGALSIMTSYNSIDGIPSTANAALLSDLLRDAWKFRGFVVSDLYSIEGIHDTHAVAPDLPSAARMALQAGVDVDLGGDAFRLLYDSLQQGFDCRARLDSAVARVLRLKFEMGLFEHPYVDPAEAALRIRSAEHVALARRAALESITLLKNDKGLLPLSKSLKRIAVVGPNANNQYNQLGDYTAPQPDSCVVTVLDGICAKFPNTGVTYVPGCRVRDVETADIEAAVRAAREADVVIAVVGGSSARDFRTDYQSTGAATVDVSSVSDMECGEGYDRASLELLGQQLPLLKALKRTSTPLVVIYIEGRPLDKVWASEMADALLTAYYPGGEGGHAIADVLTGDYNPAGRLPISVPRSVGQLPVYYNKRVPAVHDYVELSALPLYPFGYGLSYTTFEYSNLNVEKVAQLYVRDVYASVVQPHKQLKGFERVMLQPGESCNVKFYLSLSDLEIVDAGLHQTFEPGEFRLMVGSSSADIRLEQSVVLEQQDFDN
jgi:beta-glucosidase